MKDASVCLIGLVFVVSVSAEPLLEGQVRLESGEPVADAQVRLFDLSNLRQGAIARALTDGRGYFALPLAALGGRVLPERFALGPNYPNPFNPSTIIPYQLAASSEVRLEVFNLLGQRIATLVDGERPAGFHTATWHATDAVGRAVGAGVYIYRMTVGVESQTGRMVLLDGQAGVSAAGAASGGLGMAGVGGLNGPDAQVYGLIVSGEGLAPYVDSSFRVEVGMAPVELVVSAGPHSAGKAVDDDCAFCDLFDALNDGQEEEEARPSGKAQAILEAPSPPTNLRFDAPTDSSCTVRWDAADGAADYDVNYKPAVGGRWTNEPHRGIGLSNTIDDLQPNTEYRWAVRAENSEGTSEWIHGPNFTTLPSSEDDGLSDAPASPTNLRFDAPTDSSCTVRWDASDGATDYDVNYKPAVGGRWTNEPHRGIGLSNTIDDLQPNTEYRWAVRAENSEGTSEWIHGPNFTTLPEEGPDLIVQSPSVSAVVLTPGQEFTLQVTVHNQGDEQAAATMLHYYRSNNSTITSSDTEVGTDAIDALDASATSAKSIALTAPTSVSAEVGIYYGACVASVSGESDTDNNCSSAVKITVNGQEAPEEDEETTPEEDEESEEEEEETPEEEEEETTEEEGADGQVSIPDANLRAAIAAALDKARGATITKGEMTTLTGLEARHADIRDLTGLEFATNLTSLDLYYNNISDVSPLSGLTNLWWLSLIGNNITDISPLFGLTNLTDLQLIGNTEITDVSPLSGLTNLELLTFGDTEITDISALSGLTNLTLLEIPLNNITDISALSGLTNLGWLSLWGNNITDISPLGGLTNLYSLVLSNNNITDVSSLSGLTNLTWLGLGHLDLMDISPLGGLTNLNTLVLSKNNITDVSPLAGLTNLTELRLDINNITDISPLRSLTNLILLELRWNPLNDSSLNDHIPALQSRGVTVFFFSRLRKGDFDIELVFLDSFTEDQKNVLRLVAQRWMSVITEDLPDYEFTQGWSGTCGDQSYAIPSGERIDDLRIYVTSFDDNPDAVGWGRPDILREATYLPVLGCMAFDLERANLLITGLHEVGHVLGFGPVWHDLDLIQDFSRDDPNADTHFRGPLAIAAFDDAGGRNYTGKKVPVEKMDGSHWRGSAFWSSEFPESPGELMMPGGGGALSAITVQSLADLGYGVDVSQADAYTLPDAAAKASAKIVALPSMPGYGMGISQADSYTLPGADPHWQGRIAGGLPSIFGDDRLRGRLESAKWVGDRGFDLRDRLMGRLAPSPRAVPKLSCGVDFRREPIYVIDPQGRIIRTISH